MSAQSAAAPSPFPPIADYAFLSDCHTGALVAPDGSIDWLCIPCFDAPSLFGSLLDREAGTFRFAPYGIHHPTARVYEPGTMVLATTWKTPNGWVLVRDALTLGPTDHEDEITPHTRPPADDDAEHVLVRTVVCLEGSVEIELVCEPAFDYGQGQATWTLADGSRHTADASGSGQTVRLQSDLALGVEGNRVHGRHVLAPGDRAYCALSWAEHLAAPQDFDEADAMLAATTRFWRSWLGRARIPDHHWRDPIQRSALVIKGLTYMPTGATVAAPTTSLPETPGGERNWDYRFTWMRDATFTLQALHWLGLDWEADEFMQFVADVEPTDDGSLQIMCWVALDRAAALAGIRGDPELATKWAATADEIRADVLAHGVSDAGVLRQHYATDSLDASTLLAGSFGFLPGDDERLKATVRAIAENLTENGFVLRYRTEETDDGLSGEEGTFLICSFWLVSAFAIVGELQEARDRMERLLRISSPLGLYAEEFDVGTGRHLGNFPQAFSHLALIEAASRIIARSE